MGIGRQERCEDAVVVGWGPGRDDDELRTELMQLRLCKVYLVPASLTNYKD